MIIVQLNLYIFLYNKIDKDFDIVSINSEKLEIPNVGIIDHDMSIKEHLDSLSENVIIDHRPTYRLLNNIILDSIYHSIYFCVVSDTTKLKEDFYKLPVKNYAIHSPNIQQIMQLIQ